MSKKLLKVSSKILITIGAIIMTIITIYMNFMI